MALICWLLKPAWFIMSLVLFLLSNIRSYADTSLVGAVQDCLLAVLPLVLTVSYLFFFLYLSFLVCKVDGIFPLLGFTEISQLKQINTFREAYLE